jgi:ABC-type transport system substrate-binding protein
VPAWLASVSALAVAVAVMLRGFGAAASAPSASAASSAQPVSGGTLTVLEAAGGIGDWPQGLDPAVNSLSAEDEPMEDAIYGQLFTENAKGQAEPDLATGYKFLDGGKTVDIFLRHGVTFADGTPFNASAVAWNIRRDLDPKNACLCDTSFPVATPLSTGVSALATRTAWPPMSRDVACRPHRLPVLIVGMIVLTPSTPEREHPVSSTLLSVSGQMRPLRWAP